MLCESGRGTPLLREASHATCGRPPEATRQNLQEAIQLVFEANRGPDSGVDRRADRDSRTPPSSGVKRREPIKHLEAHGCRLLREGGAHSVYVNRTAGKATTVTRHRELSDHFARKICHDLDVPIP